MHIPRLSATVDATLNSGFRVYRLYNLMVLRKYSHIPFLPTVRQGCFWASPQKMRALRAPGCMGLLEIFLREAYGLDTLPFCGGI